MLYETELLKSIKNNNFNDYKILIEEKNANPFCFGMDMIELCVHHNSKDFIELALNNKDKYEFNPTTFLEKVNKKEYNDLLFKILKEYKEEINFINNSEIIIKNIIKSKNKELLLYIIKETSAYPFINEENIVIKLLIEYDMHEILSLIIKDINFQNELIEVAVMGYSYNNYRILKDNFKFKIDYIRLLRNYFSSNLKETEESLKIIKDIISNISPIEVMKNLKIRKLYYYNIFNNNYNNYDNSEEKNKAFKLLVDYALTDKESYFYLNDLFKYQVFHNCKNNVKYLLTKSDLLIEEIKKRNFKDYIKVLLKLKEDLKYLYTYEDLYYFLRKEIKNEDLILEIFKDKNFSKFVNINKILKNVENEKLRNMLKITLNINNF